jgi:ATP-dependent protease HslVU (ClpYQ) peptidase subunit
MTAVVAIEHQGRVWLGADSAGVDNTSMAISTRLDRKIFWNNGYLIGFAGSFRAGQIVKHKFEMPAFPPEFLPQNACPEIMPEKICLKDLPENLLIKVENFFATDFIETVQLAFSEAGWTKSDDDSFTMIVCVGPYMITVEDDLQIAIESDYVAVGSGAPVALGALAVLKGKPETRIMKALEIASKHNAGVRSPFYYDHT